MSILKTTVFLFVFTLLNTSGFCQTDKNGGWFFVTHTQKLSKKLELLADVQTRSGDRFKHFQTLLLRAAINYKFTKNNAVAVGYAFKDDWMIENGKTVYGFENRIYEQYLFNTTVKLTELTFRFRQEQRFVKEEESADFSQRSRVFLSAQIPLAANADFSKGLYATIQNEFFANTQNKENVNNSFFDQNRAFISVGYRWSKKIDTEVGYMRWLQKEQDGNVSANILQLMITTNL